MAGTDGGARTNGMSIAQPGTDSLTDATRALIVAVCAGFAARVPDQGFAEAKAEMDAIRAALEEATNRIIDAGAEIDAIAEDVDEEVRDRLAAATGAIYESMGFQDLTGQRLSKVERFLAGVQESVSGAAPAGGEGASETDDLLHGPQLPGNALAQDDIDAMLAGD
jgi:chemotaxis protein CheZ